jgi:putative ABC transport system permease protein
MLKNYFKIAWRNLISNKVSSLINIGGLAVGMAISFMLLLYVYNEFSFDKFHTNNGRLYQVFKNQTGNGEIKTKAFTPQKLAAILKKDFPEVENVARINEAKDFLISYNNKALKINTVAVDPALLQIFDFEFISGSKRNALADPLSIIITRSSAKALFGNSDAVGKTIKFDQYPLKVSAVIADHPLNSSFSFKAIIPWEEFLIQQPWLKNEGWDNYSYFTYVLLKSGASVNVVNTKIKNLVGEHFPQDKDVKLFMYPYQRLHLYGEFKNGVNTGGSIAYVRLFLLLAIGILLIACINFMNLSTAQSEKRAREVGIRKAMGAQRLALIKQFMGESMLMALLSFALSFILIVLLLPVFVSITHLQLNIPYSNVWAWGIALAVTLFTGFIAGSYPALFLSAFNPIKVLKGQFSATNSTVRPRQVLVVLQFTFAVCLILSSIYIYKQINYIAGRPVGYNRNGLIEMPLDGAMFDSFENFRHDAITAGAITEGAVISEPINSLTGASWKNIWPGQLPGEDMIPIDCIAATYHFIDTYQFKIVEGRDFDRGVKTDSTAIILNQAAVKLMRLNEPLGKTIKWMGADRKVVGVVKDFVWGSPYEPVKPTIIGFMKDWVGNIGLRLNPDKPVNESLAILSSIYKKYNPAYPFEYKFTDESFSKKFQSEQLLGTMSVVFTFLAIIISCLGLFGLASFSAEQRRKEISIRKVLGASVPTLWFKLSQEFLRLVVIAFIIGSAISWYNINNWLSAYTYHTSLSAGVFIITFLLSLFICLIAVSWQAVKAAWANPVKNLRSE